MAVLRSAAMGRLVPECLIFNQKLKLQNEIISFKSDLDDCEKLLHEQKIDYNNQLNASQLQCNQLLEEQQQTKTLHDQNILQQTKTFQDMQKKFNNKVNENNELKQNIVQQNLQIEHIKKLLHEEKTKNLQLIHYWHYNLKWSE